MTHPLCRQEWLLVLLLMTGCTNTFSVGEECYRGVCTGCNAELCEDGCCSDGRCIAPSPSACGTDGEECIDCGSFGNTCSDSGECFCGLSICNQNERCEDGECRCGGRLGCGNTGRCVDGGCRCGGESACDYGQRCEGGECLCDALSCPGCCWGDVTCQREPSDDACGLGGENCKVCLSGESCHRGDCLCGDGPGCSPATADHCTVTSACLCGSAPACSSGLFCIDGRCECTPESCPNGCCHPGACFENSVETCGTGGRPCVQCESIGDQCTGRGECLCGGLPGCLPIFECVDGSCQ